MAARKKPAIQLQPTGIVDDIVIPIAKTVLRKVAKKQVQRAEKEFYEGSSKAASTLGKSVKNKATADKLVVKQMTSYKNKEAKGVVQKLNNKKLTNTKGTKTVIKNKQKQQKLMSKERQNSVSFKLQDIYSSPIKKSNMAAVSKGYRVRSRKQLKGK